MTNKASLLMPEIAIIREVMQHADAEYDMRERAALRLQTETLRAENELLKDCAAVERKTIETKDRNLHHLRAENERLLGIREDMHKEADKLRAENSRLREALEGIAMCNPLTQGDIAVRLACAALQSKGE